MRNDERQDPRYDARADEVEVRVPNQRDGLSSRDERDHDASLGELFRRLTSDTTDLLRAEVELAKAEARETGTRLARDASRIGIAAALAFMGMLSLSAFLVIGLGNLLGGRYWLSALLVGVAAAGIGYTMLQTALRDIRERGVKPEQTIASLRENAQWARQEAREVKRELTGPPSPYHTGSATNSSTGSTAGSTTGSGSDTPRP